MIDLSALDVIRQADEHALRDVDQLEEVLPHLGLNGDLPGLFPDELQRFLGRGLHYWQYPCQLAPFLTRLSELSIRSYLEVGVMHGGTFALVAEYLFRTTGLRRAVAVDVMRVPSVRRLARSSPGITVLREDSASARFRATLAASEAFDLAFIDADHSYEAVKRDFETVRPHARMLALHDIVDGAAPGVRRFWREVQETHAENYRFEEFTAQYPAVRTAYSQDYLGIGLLLPRGDTTMPADRV